MSRIAENCWELLKITENCWDSIFAYFWRENSKTETKKSIQNLLGHPENTTKKLTSPFPPSKCKTFFFLFLKCISCTFFSLMFVFLIKEFRTFASFLDKLKKVWKILWKSLIITERFSNIWIFAPKMANIAPRDFDETFQVIFNHCVASSKVSTFSGLMTSKKGRG